MPAFSDNYANSLQDQGVNVKHVVTQLKEMLILVLIFIG